MVESASPRQSVVRLFFLIFFALLILSIPPEEKKTKKLAGYSSARPPNFDEHSLRSVSDVRSVRTAECRASLVEVKLLHYLGRPPKGQTEGAICVDDLHAPSP